MGCSRILTTPIGELPIRYLGVPLADRRLRIRDWQPVLEKVETRLGGWRARLLSQGGRLVMLKAVLSAIPTSFMSIFQLPVGVRRRLETVMRGFFWHGPCPEEARGTALVAWEIVCRPVSQGGLGIHSLLHTNLALLTKWVCCLLTPPGDLVSALRQDCYTASLDRNKWQTPQRGDSSSRHCSPISDPSWAPGRLFVFGWTSGRGMDVCASHSPGCSLSHQTRRALWDKHGTTRGPRPCLQGCRIRGRLNSSVCRNYWQTSDSRRGRMGGFGASRDSLSGQPIAASGHRRAQRTCSSWVSSDGS